MSAYGERRIPIGIRNCVRIVTILTALKLSHINIEMMVFETHTINYYDTGLGLILIPS